MKPRPSSWATHCWADPTTNFHLRLASKQPSCFTRPESDRPGYGKFDRLRNPLASGFFFSRRSLASISLSIVISIEAFSFVGRRLEELERDEQTTQTRLKTTRHDRLSPLLRCDADTISTRDSGVFLVCRAERACIGRQSRVCSLLQRPSSGVVR